MSLVTSYLNTASTNISATNIVIIFATVAVIYFN